MFQHLKAKGFLAKIHICFENVGEMFGNSLILI